MQLGELAITEPKKRSVVLYKIDDIQKNLDLLRIRYSQTKNPFERHPIKLEGIELKKKLNRLIGQYKIKLKGETDDDFVKEAVDYLV